MNSVKDYITVGISIVALLISGVTFYLTNIHDPGVSFEIAPRLEWITDKNDQETFILPITITSTGARGHVVNQIVLRIEDDASRSPARYVANRFAVRRATPSEFSPEALTPGSSVARSYLFERFDADRNTVRNVGKTPTSPENFAFVRPGRYRGTILVRLNGSTAYETATRFSFALEAEELKRLRRKPYGTQMIFNLRLDGA